MRLNNLGMRLFSISLARKAIATILVLALFVLGVPSSLAAPAEKADWEDRYESFLNGKLRNSAEDGYALGATTHLRSLILADLHKDGTPELILVGNVAGQQGLSSYTVKNGQVVACGTVQGTGNLSLYRNTQTKELVFLLQDGSNISQYTGTSLVPRFRAKQDGASAYLVDGRTVSKDDYSSQRAAYIAGLEKLLDLPGSALGASPQGAYQREANAYKVQAKASVEQTATAITMVKKTTLYVGESTQLVATVTPATAGEGMTWSSSKASVAVVSQTGLVLAKKSGTATISVKTISGKKASCKVTVKVRKVTSVSFQSPWTEIGVGEARLLTALALPENATNRSVSYKSANKKIATVTASGQVTGKKAGKVKITATAKDGSKKKAVLKITVVKDRQDGVPQGTYNASSPDDFTSTAANLLSQQGLPGGAGGTQSGSKYACKRLLVQSDGRQIDYSIYRPKTVIVSPDGFAILQFDTESATEAAYHALSVLNGIVFVEPDEVIGLEPIQRAALNYLPKATYNSWGVSRIQADQYSNYLASTGVGSIVVAVVDTGVGSHSFLNGKMYSNGRNFVETSLSARNDDHGHGTHVAGTIVDCTQSLNVRILPVRVMYKDPSTGRGVGSTAAIALGIRYAADQGAKVINLSLGGGHNAAKESAIDYAMSKGSTVVVSAGNDYGDTNNACPAHITKCIVVGASDSNNNKAAFSNAGSSLDVIAPGVSIISCLPGGKYDAWNGTSMAAPHVSAAAAMVKLANPSYTPAQIESTLRANVLDLGSPGWDRQFGTGLPQLSKLIPAQPTSVALNSTSLSLKVGDSSTLTATVAPAGATNKTVTWSTSNAAVATVSSGKVTAIKVGTATITATTVNGKTASCKVTITSKDVLPTGISLSASALTLQVGGTQVLTATVTPSNATDKSVTWSTSKSGVATVSTGGSVRGVASGTATITAKTSNGLTATCVVTVPATPTWGAWGAWQDTRESTNENKQEESRYVYPYYYYRCSYCGAHMHVYTSCYTWAGGCGRSGGMSYSVGWTEVWSVTSYDAAGLKDWHGTGRWYAYVDGQLVFKWTDRVYPKWQYRYRTRQ